jgi:hypothetical protein
MSAAIPLFQQFRSLPLQEQIKLSTQINQFLMQCFETITSVQNENEAWQLLSKQGLNKAYSDDEPNYNR